MASTSSASPPRTPPKLPAPSASCRTSRSGSSRRARLTKSELPPPAGAAYSGPSGAPSGLVPREGLVTLAHVIYGLHAFSALTGMLSPAMIVTAFLTGWPSIIAVILNYVKRSEVRGTWLDSHFSWQIRTFWFALLWLTLCALFIIVTLGIGIVIAWLPLAFVSIWFIY